MAFTYCPLQGIVGENIIADGSGGELLPYSQRPKVWIFPQTCEGGEMTLPFFYHKNWLNITSAADTINMGTITPALYAQLVSATGITGTSVVVNVYAWAEDVKLHAPTTKLALQASEFDYKPSQIASSVASAAKNLSRIPLIGPYMKATSIVSSGLSSIASSLGFTNVPNMDTVSYLKNSTFPHNSTCEVSVPCDRSAVDPKNEVCLDPRTVGLDGQDELSISYICQRETWIGNAILSSTDSVDALTLVSRVTPALTYLVAGANKPTQYTPCGYLSTQFKYWRGDMIFRFKFICTRFHKGRVRITFDPTNNISTSVPDYTTVFNEVVDIGAEQDVEVRIPYSQALTFLKTNPVSGNWNFAGTALSPDEYSNGLITMRVVNPLSGPVANTAIPVMVFVRAADNLEFAHPQNKYNNVNLASPYALQSGEVSYPLKPKQVIAGNAETTGDPNKYHVHFGEAIVSLRPLLHRLGHHYTMRSPNFSTNGLSVVTQYQSRNLKYPGYDPNGVFSAEKKVGVGTAPYNFMRCGIHQMISLLFVGQRGSMNHSINLESNIVGIPSNFQIKRFSNTIAVGSYNILDSLLNYVKDDTAQFILKYVTDPGSGTALTDPHIQPGMVMNFPYYSPYNFQFVKPSTATLGQSDDGTDNDHIVTQVIYEKSSASAAVRINYWIGLGPDYNFFFFRNTPSLYVYDQPEPPA